MFYDLDGQAARKRQLYRKLTDYTLRYFGSDGLWIGSDKEPDLRERLWYALGYLESGDSLAAAAANRLIAATAFRGCHFAPMAALQLLVKFGGRLEPGAKAALDGYLAGALDSFTGPDHDFRGANDNFPTMGAYTLLIGGALYGRPDLERKGVERLRQFEALLTRRGFASEFNSPTYTPFQLLCMAEIAEWAADPAVRGLALQLEERLWADIWSHYHPATFQTAGPYSRAYEVDSTAHTHQSRFVLYALIGEQLAIHPLNTLFSTPRGKEGELLHHNLPFMQVSTGWLMHTTYHCPAYLVAHGLNKTYPYRVQGTYEYASSTDRPQPPNPLESDDTVDIPAGSGNASTYMTEDYALGVMSREFRTGVFTDSFHLLYRRRTPVAAQRDIGVVYANYIVNDKKPGQMNDYVELNWRNWQASVLDEGRKIGLHHDRTAMLLYKPKQLLHKRVTSLKLSLLFPARYGFVEEVWLGDRRLDRLEGDCDSPCPVFVKDGPVYMAFFPLLFTDYGRPAAVKVERINGYLSVSFYNYEGPARDFAQRGFLLTGNGFVAEVRSESEVGSFAAFRGLFGNVRILDEWAYGNQITHMRRTRYERDGLELECVWNPISEGIKYAAVNGRIPAERQLAMTGLDPEQLPFMGGGENQNSQ
ncbi:MAG: hypothetical protein J7639_29195 [Paenibacillaceae bacterium]|nr:hypothetical protein [Paenibacillaceae bacterium]